MTDVKTCTVEYLAYINMLLCCARVKIRLSWQKDNASTVSSR